MNDSPNVNDELEMANVEPVELDTNQEATVIPWFVGDRKIAVRWICDVTGVYAVEVDVGGKK